MRSLLALALLLSACQPQAPLPSAQLWPEADALFSNDPLWLGSDGDYSTDLGDGRVLWMFGDTTIARDATRSTSNSWFIRNSCAIQTGYDPSKAFMSFYWSQTDGHPSSFIPEIGNSWLWPGPAFRVGPGLIIFGQRLVQASSGDFGFLGVGTAAYFVADANPPPDQWTLVDANPPNEGESLILGTAGMMYDGFLYVYGNRDGDAHDMVIARFAESDAATGDLSKGQFYTGGKWVDVADLKGLPDAIFSLGPPEASVYFEPRVGEFLMVQSEGFGSTTLALRSAPHPEGPWTNARSFFLPPESTWPDAFVYAGKGHAELVGADLIVTYYASTFGDNSSPDLEFPHFVKVTFP